MLFAVTLSISAWPAPIIVLTPVLTSGAMSVSASRRCNSCRLASNLVSAAWVSPPVELASIAASSEAM